MPAVILWPKNARWYMPQDTRPACPHCACMLRDRTLQPLDPVEVVVFAGVLLINLVRMPRAVSLSLTVLILALLAYRTWTHWRGRKEFSEEDKYVVAEP